MTLSELVLELRSLTGISDLSLDERTRACRLVFGDELEVEFEEIGSGDVFFVHAVIGTLPRTASADAYRELLKSQLFGLDTGGACFGYDEGREELLLFQRFDVRAVDVPSFTRELERFLDTMRRWTEKLRKGIDASERPDPGFLQSGLSFLRG